MQLFQCEYCKEAKTVTFFDKDSYKSICQDCLYDLTIGGKK